MSEYEYKVGDVVEIVKDEVYSDFKGRRAVVKDIVDGERFPFIVQFFDDNDTSAQNASEIKLVTPRAEPAAEKVGTVTAEDSALPQRTSDADKLRVLAAVIDAQAPFGTELADFKRRLQIVLGA